MIGLPRSTYYRRAKTAQPARAHQFASPSGIGTSVDDADRSEAVG